MHRQSFRVGFVMRRECNNGRKIRIDTYTGNVKKQITIRKKIKGYIKERIYKTRFLKHPCRLYLIIIYSINELVDKYKASSKTRLRDGIHFLEHPFLPPAIVGVIDQQHDPNYSLQQQIVPLGLFFVVSSYTMKLPCLNYFLFDLGGI